jgi:hypothetical protein
VDDPRIRQEFEVVAQGSVAGRQPRIRMGYPDGREYPAEQDGACPRISRCRFEKRCKHLIHLAK